MLFASVHVLSAAARPHSLIKGGRTLTANRQRAGFGESADHEINLSLVRDFGLCRNYRGSNAVSRISRRATGPVREFALCDFDAGEFRRHIGVAESGARIYPAETHRHFVQKFQSAVDWARGDGWSRFRYCN